MATSGPDLLKGGDAADRIDGGDGDDVIFGFDGQRTGPDVGRIVVERVGRGFDGAVFAGHAPERADDLFVVRKDVGRIQILDPATGQRSPFLNIPNAEMTTGGEQGLLGLAFHPDYADNGRFFVNLVNAKGNIEIREYARSAGDADRADPEPVQRIVTVPHPGFGNHNGGALAFGPNDGYLYVALGDGGGANDPAGNAQNKRVLLGKILRIDVDGDDFPTKDGRNFAVPSDNPFVGVPGSNKIWAYGLRNPWRISFDDDGALYIADVGQGAREEVNHQPADSAGGENYGWDLAEGALGAPPAGATPPIFEYGRDLGESITGGYVYHGAEASLQGAYVFTDFISGEFWTLKVENGEATGVTRRTTQLAGPDGPLRQVASFGIDGDGRLFAVSLAGDIFRLNATAHAGDLGDRLRGGAGDDRVYGGPGDDRLFGDGEADLLRGGFGDDALYGGRGRDRIDGDAGGDRLTGAAGADHLRGGLGDDVVCGGRGPDRLDGGSGGDSLGGGGGDDRLSGGDGRDRLRGGSGADRFVFDSTPTSNAVADRISDFLPGADAILLERTAFSAIGAQLSSREFRVGQTAASEVDHILYDPESGALAYDADGDDAGRGTIFARLARGLDLSADDFLVF